MNIILSRTLAVVFEERNIGRERLPLVVPSLMAIAIAWLLVGGRADACAGAQGGDSQSAMMWRRLANTSVVGVYDHPVRLSDGQCIGAPFAAGGHSRPLLRLWPKPFAVGDLDGLPGEEVTGLLSETAGGSGEHVYLLAGQVRGDTLSTWPAQLVGDRIKVRALQIKDRQIILDIIEAGEQEPLCCGTVLTRLVWKLGTDGLRLTNKISQGHLVSDGINGE